MLSQYSEQNVLFLSFLTSCRDITSVILNRMDKKSLLRFEQTCKQNWTLERRLVYSQNSIRGKAILGRLNGHYLRNINHKSYETIHHSKSLLDYFDRTVASCTQQLEHVCFIRLDSLNGSITRTN